jgi:hypothetical protein
VAKNVFVGVDRFQFPPAVSKIGAKTLDRMAAFIYYVDFLAYFLCLSLLL